MVDPRIELVRGIRLHGIRQVVVGYTGLIPVPGNVRRGKRIDELLGDQIPAVLRNLIVRERLARLLSDVGSRGIKYRTKSAEISIAPGQWRNCSEKGVPRALTSPLIIEKEKRPVFAAIDFRDEDRSTRAEAELVQLERRNRVGGGIKKVFGIEGAIPQKLVERPV